jgi:hypothetical protein
VGLTSYCCAAPVLFHAGARVGAVAVLAATSVCGHFKIETESKPKLNLNRPNYWSIRVLRFDSVPINTIFRGMSSVPNF